MKFIEGKSVVITGISKGIGACLVNQLLDAGATVIGWGRTPSSVQHDRLHFISCNVQDREDVAKAMEQTRGITPNIDFLINNAGFGTFQPIDEFDHDTFHEMLMVNVEGAFNVTREIAGGMKSNGSGHIINISSIAGRVGAPWGAGYNASKFALTGFSESLFHELRKSGVKVTSVYPGSTRTDFFNEIKGMEAHSNMLNPDDVAADIVHAMNTPPNHLIREIEIRPLISKKPEQ